MATCYDIFKDDFLFIRVIGEVTLDDAQKLMRKIRKDSRFIPYEMNTLVDYAHGIIAWDSRMIDRAVIEAQARLPIKRTALFAPDSPTTLRVLQQIAETSRRMGRQVAAFDCPLAAMRWLWTDEPLQSIDKRCVLHQVQRQRHPLPT